jgi:chemotaxis protein CheX
MSSFQKNHCPRLVLDETLARSIISGVEVLFNSTFGIKLIAGKFQITNDYHGLADISGHIGMFQDSLEGTMTVGFPSDVILKIIGKAYKKDFSEINKSVREGVGEMTNIIYAQVKKTLNERGFKFKMSVPQVIVGKDHEYFHLHSGSSLVVPFTSENGQFVVFVTLQPSK